MTWLQLEIIKLNSPNQKDQYWIGKEPNLVIKISFYRFLSF